MATCKDLKKFVDWYKGNAPCADCGASFPPECMDLDHVPERGEKCGNIRDFISVGDERQLWNELGKCDVVCACCHRTRTKRRGPARAALRNLSRATKGRPKPIAYRLNWDKHHGHLRTRVHCSDGRVFDSLLSASNSLKVPLTTLYRRVHDGRSLKNGLTVSIGDR